MIEDDNITHPHQVAEIKQAFVEIYKDEYKPESTEDIFDDLNEIESVSDSSCDETANMQSSPSQGSTE